jgi:hypothetical protein
LVTAGFARERKMSVLEREKSVLGLLGVFMVVKRKILASSERGEVEERERRKEEKEKNVSF